MGEAPVGDGGRCGARAFAWLAGLFFTADLILGESPSWLQLLGAAGILSGLVIASLGRRQPALETRRDAPSSASSAALTDT